MTHTLQKHKIEHRYYIIYIYGGEVVGKEGRENNVSSSYIFILYWGELFSSRYELFTRRALENCSLAEILYTTLTETKKV